jgi:hypothetical protein
MAWVRFTQDWPWMKPRFTVAYKRGMVQNITRQCLADATKAGVIVRLYRKNKNDPFSEIEP